MATFPGHHHLRIHVRPSASAAMGCDDVRARLWEFLDGELEPNVTVTLRAHLAACPACLAQHDAGLAFLGIVAASERSEDRAPAALRERVNALLRERGLTS